MLIIIMHGHFNVKGVNSEADFLSVESVICFFTGRNSCSRIICAILLPNYEHCRIDSLQLVPLSCGD